MIDEFPAVAILGPRQSGKTTFAKQLSPDHVFDLENPRDRRRLEHPELALSDLRGLIAIDEVQLMPSLFPLLRHLVDRKLDQTFVLLGSASPTIVTAISESLSGRVGHLYLTPFLLNEVDAEGVLWLRGGYPRSYLAQSDGAAFRWLDNYVQTFLERDLPQLGFRIGAMTLRRFWTMLAHYHGQVLNFSELGRSFGVSDNTVRHYIDILEQTFMVRLLLPWHNNTKKRLVKSPKLYLRDSGLFHSLMGFERLEEIQSHPKLGASWEGFCLEQIVSTFIPNQRDVYFWATHGGAELDLYWTKGGKRFGVEIKYADAPRLTRSMKTAIDELELDALTVIYPGRQSYQLADNVECVPLKRFVLNNG